MSDYKAKPLIDRLKDNILFNWSHLSHYGDDMREAAEALEQAQNKNKWLKKQLDALANFNPDWDVLEATQTSLREHMQELKKSRKRIEQLEADFELATNLRDEAVSDLYTANEHIEQLEGEIESLTAAEARLQYEVEQLDALLATGQDND